MRVPIKVVADLDLCQAHQVCQDEAPDVFGFDDDADKVVVLVEQPDEVLRDDVANAVRYCPAMALSTTEVPGVPETTPTTED